MKQWAIDAANTVVQAVALLVLCVIWAAVGGTWLRLLVEAFSWGWNWGTAP